MFSDWKSYLSRKTNRINLSITLFFLITILIILPKFLSFIETRDGVAFTDPILKLFQPVNLTWFIFSLIYFGLIIALIHLSKKPDALILAFKVYSITVLFRMLAMYLLPLNPPDLMVPLDDPFVQFFGEGEVLTKDLFFSGHTSTMFIFFLTAYSKKLKLLFLFFTLLVAVSVLLQHVHYTIDVFAAPFFAYTSYKLSVIIEKFLQKS